MTPIQICEQVMQRYSITKWAMEDHPLTHTIDVYSEPILWPEIIRKLETDIKGYIVIALPYFQYQAK